MCYGVTRRGERAPLRYAPGVQPLRAGSLARRELVAGNPDGVPLETCFRSSLHCGYVLSCFNGRYLELEDASRLGYTDLFRNIPEKLEKILIESFERCIASVES